MVRLDVFSDPVCPWCMIGKALLDRALAARPDHRFAVAWHPFQLNPDMPEGGIDRDAYLAAKFGGPDGAAEVTEHVEQAAADAGVVMNLHAIRRAPNTLDTHRLIHWAGIEGAQDAVVEGLFDAYFRQGRDIGAADVLADIAGEAGLDRATVARLLATDADRTAVADQIAQAGARGIRAVPTFIVAEGHAVPGAQPVAFWTRVIDEIATLEP